MITKQHAQELVKELVKTQTITDLCEFIKKEFTKTDNFRCLSTEIQVRSEAQFDAMIAIAKLID